MNWYKPKDEKFKGWRVTAKKVKVDGGFYMYESRIYRPDSPMPIIPNMLSDYKEQAISNGWAWLEEHLK